MDLPAASFELTDDERRRLETLPFNPGNDGWKSFASLVHQQLLAAYESGEIDFRQMLSTMRGCAIGCDLATRISLIALTVERGLRIKPRDLNRKKPPYPTWLRNSAGSLVQMLREEFPEKPVAPNETNNWTTDILETAKAWLVALSLCPPEITCRTIYEWHKAAERSE